MNQLNGSWLRMVLLVCKAEIERTKVWTPRGEEGGGGGMNWEIGIDIYTLICIK